MIVKVQRALAGKRDVLVYNEDRSIVVSGMGSKTMAVLEKALGKRPKAYFEAELVNGSLEIHTHLEVEEPGW
jgi:hypothetical protein